MHKFLTLFSGILGGYLAFLIARALNGTLNISVAGRATVIIASLLIIVFIIHKLTKWR